MIQLDKDYPYTVSELVERINEALRVIARESHKDNYGDACLCARAYLLGMDVDDLLAYDELN